MLPDQKVHVDGVSEGLVELDVLHQLVDLRVDFDFFGLMSEYGFL